MIDCIDLFNGTRKSQPTIRLQKATIPLGYIPEPLFQEKSRLYSKGYSSKLEWLSTILRYYVSRPFVILSVNMHIR
jgi:hypothetical protein